MKNIFSLPDKLMFYKILQSNFKKLFFLELFLETHLSSILPFSFEKTKGFDTGITLLQIDMAVNVGLG